MSGLLLGLSVLLTAFAARADKQSAEAAAATTAERRRQAEMGSFDTFDAGASGYDDENAYWLSYLTLMMYPQNLGPATGVDEDRLQRSGSLFESTFKKKVEHVFTGPTTFEFSDPTNAVLYNPEVMCISTERALLVLFRGTDRLENTAPGVLGDLMYNWGEWLITDANVQLLRPPLEGLGGRLHRGMKESLDLSVMTVQGFVTKHGGNGKPVWVSGHSLGGAHAQIMAGYLKKRGANVKGVYVYNSPHPGTPQFAASLEATLGKASIQRFEYLDDPIGLLPPQTSVSQVLGRYPLPPGSPVGGFGRAGVRNFYGSQNSDSLRKDQPERQEGQSNRAELGRSGLFSPLAMCYHNPHWIANAAYGRLPAATRNRLPEPPNVSRSEGCTPLASETGRTGIPWDQELLQEALEVAGEVIEAVSFTVTNLAKNVVGTAIPEGDYFVRCNKGKQYLEIKYTCLDENGCRSQLGNVGQTERNNIFHIKKEGPSYRFLLKTNNKAVEVDAKELTSEGARVQAWDQNPIGLANANQKWFFYKVPSKSNNHYLIVNAATFKVLDAGYVGPDKPGTIAVRNGKENDQTQVWVLEKAR